MALALALGAGIVIWSGAEAATINYAPCIDVAGQAFDGMSCSVGPDDFGLSAPHSKNDTQTAVETVLAHLFGEAVGITSYIGGIEGNQDGFDFGEDDVTEEHTVTVALEQQWTFATVKASTFWALFDVRGLDEVTLTTVGLIENHKGKALDISHIGFWNPYEGVPDDHEAGLQEVAGGAVPAPAPIALLGAGLVAVAAVRRRRI